MHATTPRQEGPFRSTILLLIRQLYPHDEHNRQHESGQTRSEYPFQPRPSVNGSKRPHLGVLTRCGSDPNPALMGFNRHRCLENLDSLVSRASLTTTGWGSDSKRMNPGSRRVNEPAIDFSQHEVDPLIARQVALRGYPLPEARGQRFFNHTELMRC